ncbi:hypothetical protein RIF29_25129 [Crotalaria pallida]|uniref:Uncharacterized protein n=1 Tax=Crotalaria pallida TaxID=3830 RepID=A0AAN9EN79_CROPI
MDTRKRGRPDFNVNGGGFKKTKQELDSLSGVGSKSKPCTKFFSTAGCPFGESCHFLHYVPGGYNAVAHMINITPAAPPASRHAAAPPPPVPNGSASPTVKSRVCNKFNTAEGCKYGDKCHFAHGEWELGKPIAPSFDDHRNMGPPSASRLPGRMEPPPGPASSFGANATAKISVEASLAGAIIGKGGVNSKQICRQTGAKLSIRDHESDPNLRNIELEGSFEQIKEASNMVKELLFTLQMSAPHKTNPGVPGGHAPGGHAPPGSNFKTKLCDNFTKGSCTFGERCHFAHGAAELRKSGCSLKIADLGGSHGLKRSKNNVPLRFLNEDCSLAKPSATVTNLRSGDGVAESGDGRKDGVGEVNPTAALIKQGGGDHANPSNQKEKDLIPAVLVENNMGVAISEEPLHGDCLVVTRRKKTKPKNLRGLKSNDLAKDNGKSAAVSHGARVKGLVKEGDTGMASLPKNFFIQPGNFGVGDPKLLKDKGGSPFSREQDLHKDDHNDNLDMEVVPETQFTFDPGQTKFNPAFLQGWMSHEPLCRKVLWVATQDTGMQVRDVWQQGTWHLQELYTILPNEVQQEILNSDIVVHDQVLDVFTWQGDLSGIYTAKSGYDWLSSCGNMEQQNGASCGGVLVQISAAGVELARRVYFIVFGIVAKARCVECIANEPLATMEVLRLAKGMQEDIQRVFGVSSLKAKEVRWISWSPPVSNGVVLNVDGSSLGNPGCAGYGGLITNKEGASKRWNAGRIAWKF